VDAGSPEPARGDLKGLGASGKVRLIRVDEYLTPNAARNVGYRAASGHFVVFADNDVSFAPGWLPALLTSMDETGAGIVGPLIYEREPAFTFLHDAGTYLKFAGPAGRHSLDVTYVDASFRSATQSADTLMRERPRYTCEAVEFHCMLVRRAVLESCGPCDEGLMSVREHLDFCLTAGRAGFPIFVEPSAAVTFLRPPPTLRSDRPFFFLRWSDDWTTATARHFDRKWGVEDPGYADHELEWVRDYRRAGGWTGLAERLERIAGWRLSRKLLDLTEQAYAMAGRRHHRTPHARP
jgi:glycosyltransferase involved in cell wall biosynthesis